MKKPSFVDRIHINSRDKCDIKNYYFYKDGYLQGDEQFITTFIELINLYNKYRFWKKHIKPKSESTIWMKGIYNKEGLIKIEPLCSNKLIKFDTSIVYTDLRELLSSGFFQKHIDSVYFPIANSNNYFVNGVLINNEN